MKKTKIITLSSLDTSKYEKNAPFYKVYYNLKDFFESIPFGRNYPIFY